jgi:hypothetical protein
MTYFFLPRLPRLFAAGYLPHPLLLFLLPLLKKPPFFRQKNREQNINMAFSLAGEGREQAGKAG